MSNGDTCFPHADVLAAVHSLWARRWHTRPERAFEIAGSLRRARPWVNDIDLVAPLPPSPPGGDWMPADDDLFRAIDETMSNRWFHKPGRPCLFTAEEENACMDEGSPFRPLGKAVRGLKPGFLAASLELEPKPGLWIPCQIFRYGPRNKGWVMLQRTGPADFGKWFLGMWKRRYRIPLGDEKHSASINGHLVDADGQVVDVPTEEAAFELAGLKFIPPDLRDVTLEDVRRAEMDPLR